MYIYFITYFIWISSEFILSQVARSGKKGRESADNKTELFIWLTIIVSVTLGVYISNTTRFLLFENERIRIAGLLIIISGMIIRFIAIKQLGRYFTVNVTIRENHQLMQTGLYKYVRHPSYSGSLLSFLGFGITLNNWISLGIVLFFPLLSFLKRIRLEESVLNRQFGKEYRDYISRTKRLIPFLY